MVVRQCNLNYIKNKIKTRADVATVGAGQSTASTMQIDLASKCRLHLPSFHNTQTMHSTLTFLNFNCRPSLRKYWCQCNTLIHYSVHIWAYTDGVPICVHPQGFAVHHLIHVCISQSRECTVMRKVFTFARDGVVDHCVSQNATPDHENSEQLVQIP